MTELEDKYAELTARLILGEIDIDEFADNRADLFAEHDVEGELPKSNGCGGRFLPGFLVGFVAIIGFVDWSRQSEYQDAVRSLSEQAEKYNIAVPTGRLTEDQVHYFMGEVYERMSAAESLHTMYLIHSIPSGTFTMGCDAVAKVAGCDESVFPQRSITISEHFYMMDSEVTQELYEAVMDTNPSTFKDPKLPVTDVSWFDAVRFANVMSEMEGLETCYIIDEDYFGTIQNVQLATERCTGWRLPTEAEWEYAARGPENEAFSGGSFAGDVAWFGYINDNDIQGTVESKGPYDVCTKMKNGYEMCDMSGNVSEWVWDWFDATLDASLPTTDPTGPESGTHRVVRGGGWDDGMRDVRVVSREGYRPNTVSSSTGFRLVTYE